VGRRVVRSSGFDEDGVTQAPSGEAPMGSPPEPVPPVRAGLIAFTPERQRHRWFVGRDDVLA
jgi:hypothetical protein